MFQGYSSFGNSVDTAFLFIFGWGIILLLGITAFMIYCVVTFSREKNPVPTNIPGHIGLEVTWTVLPTILVMFMFYFGWDGYKQMRTLPKDHMTVNVTGRMWSWSHTYANEKESELLYVPVGKAVKLILHSEDVLHSYYIPSFRVKMDVIPNKPKGQENWMWFRAEKEGTYDVYCTEYCGDLHSAMLSKVVVLSQEEFDKWYNTKGKPTGKQLVKMKGCTACHSLDGSKMIGPTWKGLFASKKKVIENGKEIEIEANEEYLAKSIVEPAAQFVKGYEKVAMPAVSLKEEEVQALVKFIKGLK